MDEDTILKIISSNIRKYRILNNLSQEELAYLSKLHRTYISQIERNKRNISVISLVKIANALKIKISDILPI